MILRACTAGAVLILIVNAGGSRNHPRFNNRIFRMKLFRIRWVVILCAAGLSACSPKKNPDAATATPPDVLVAEAVQRDTPILREWVSTLDGSANVDIRARVQGYLVRQHYKEGTLVKAGDLLFEIDARPFEAALAQAKADLSRLRASAVKAALDEKRENQMFASKATSEASRDAAVQASAAARAAVDAAQAALEQAQLNLEYCKITSPVDGIAGNAKPGVGDLVGPGGSELTTISSVDPINLSFQLSEQEYLKVAEKVNNAILAGTIETAEPSLELLLADGSEYPHKGRFTKRNALRTQAHPGWLSQTIGKRGMPIPPVCR